MLNLLPKDVLTHIATMLCVPDVFEIEYLQDSMYRFKRSRYNIVKDEEQIEPIWYEDMTIIRSAAACAMASKQLAGFAEELYRMIMKKNSLPDRSKNIPDLTSPRKVLRKTLNEWQVYNTCRMNKNKLQCLVKENMRPSRSPIHPDLMWIKTSFEKCNYYCPYDPDDIILIYDLNLPTVWKAQRDCLKKYTTLETWFQKVHLQRLRNFRKRRDRRNDLKKELEKRGCYLRSDSTLCRNYIERGHGDIEDIVDTMEEMKFMYEHTTYEQIFREMKLEYLERNKIGDEWINIPHHKISRDAKRVALDKWMRENKQRISEILPVRLQKYIEFKDKLCHHTVPKHIIF